ncbi:MAG: sigma-70 family RNA polymerase sigma factor [Planctomycetes bacterium]|nr:sigma-70 family RNA polymerase sigma factor [Planctomycetota bacterium]
MKPRTQRSRRRPDDRARAEFEGLLNPLLDALLGYSLRLAGNRPDAEDLLQESVFLAYRGFGSFRAGTNFKAWMFRIATNAFISSRRSAARAPLLSEELECVAGPAEALTEELFDADTDWRCVLGDAVEDEVRAALEELPEDFRIPLLLSCLGDMRYKEIAETIGVPVGTVMSRLFRARQRLRRSLRDYAAARGIALKGTPA